MTVSATWLKATLLPLALVLTACQGSPESQATAPAAPAPVAPAVRSGQEPAAAVPSVPAGLTPLPSPQQVVAAQPVGRADPFVPVVAAAGVGGAAAPVLPPGFRFSGVIRSGGRAEALVQFGAESGSLRAGDVGGRTTRLLPPGWAVGSIDVGRGRLILRASGQAIPVSLDGQS